MNNIKLKERELLSNQFTIDTGVVTKQEKSQDGTRKILLSFGPDQIESM